MDVTAQKIERSIQIDAAAEVVWRIVSEPGWWINSGTLVDHEIEDLGQDTHRVTDPTHGPFVITTVASDPPHYAAFRWRPTDPEDPATLCEFFVVARPGGGVDLRVVESEFDDLPADKLPAFLRDNTSGWEGELNALRIAAEAG